MTVAPTEPTPRQGPEKIARSLLRTTRKAALATLDLAAGGAPYASLVAVASAADGAPLMLLSRLARHTANIDADSRASVLLEVPDATNPLAAARLSVAGRLVPTLAAEDRERFLARQPGARSYADFPDFRLFRLDVEGAHLVAGFGRIVDLTREQLLLDLAGAEALTAAETGAAAHMNADHSDAVQLYAQLAGAPEPAGWRFDGYDPEGFELAGHGRVLRVDFPTVLTDRGDLRRQLVELAQAARAAATDSGARPGGIS